MVDYTPWDRLLQTYVNDRGRVNYARWQQESASELGQWLASVSHTDLQCLERDAAIAFLLNLYNALTIQQVLQRYPIDSIRPKILGIPNWLAFLRFFNRKFYTLNEQPLSLNGIEHDILRSQFAEPRIHFALVCASVGCPWLRPGAYWPDQLEQQLDGDVRQFVHNPEKVRYDAEAGVLYCSKIFKWYAEDFLKEAYSIAAYINRYRPDSPVPENAPLQHLPYSWQLNQRTSS